MNEELNRLTLALWTIGPFSVLALSVLLVLFIRWQLRPLAAMSRQAAAIGPDNVAARIAAVGTSAECVQLRDAINTMVARLAEGLERERQFASMAAHELRTPVAQLRTHIEVTLRKERVSDEYRAALKDALKDVGRLQALIENLLFLTRIGHGAEMCSTVALNQVVTLAVKLSGVKTPGLDVANEVYVSGNADLLTAALRNVLDNAARYAPGNPPVLMVAENTSGVTLLVMDSGPGIPEKDRERIFEPLTRLDQARSIGESADGFGLGLTVARAAVRACGGDLTCRARADGQNGAEFVFVLKRISRQPGTRN